MLKYSLLMVVVLILASSCAEVEHYVFAQDSSIEYIEEIVFNEYQNDYIRTIYVNALLPHYPSIDAMVTGATDIVRAEVLDKRVRQINTMVSADPTDIDDRSLIYTVYRIKVLEVFGGDLESGDILDVGELGGQLGNINLVNEERLGLNIGYDLVLFLDYLRIENLPAWPLNHTQAAYRFTPAIETARRTRSFNIELESFDDRNDLTLTLSELIAIQLENNL